VTARLLLTGVLGIAALNAAGFLAGSWTLIRYPFELDYGEGIVLWQAAHVFDLRDAYHPVERYPYIVFHYPPVYHVLSRMATKVTGDLLVGGRTVSWLSAVGIAVVAGLLVSTAARAHGWSRTVAAVAAPLLVLQLATFGWIPYMRVDAAAIFYSVVGMLVFIRARSRSVRLAAGGLFVLALFCKQTMVAAPIAAVSTLLLTGFIGEGLVLGGVMAAAGLGVLGTLTWYTDGEFVRHLFVHNQNPYYVRHFLRLLVTNLDDIGILIGLALAVPVMAIRASAVAAPGDWLRTLRGLDVQQRAKFCLLCYGLAAFVVTLTAGKIGANINYFLEWNVTCCVLAGIAIGELLRYMPAHRMHTAGIVALLMVGIYGVSQLPRTAAYVRFALGRDATLNARAVASKRALDEIAAASGPVLSEDMVLLMKANKEVPWEPAIMTQLAAMRTFDETPAIEKLQSRWFSLIVVKTLNVPIASYDGRHVFYTERIRDAIEDAYEPREDLGGGYTILRPRP
jgi:hypothetical protein